MGLHRYISLATIAVVLIPYQAASQGFLDDVLNVVTGAATSTLKSGDFRLNNFLNSAATEGVTLVVRNLTIFDPSQGRNVDLDSYCRTHLGSMLGSSMPGSELANDPLGTIVRSFMNENYLLNASVLYYPPTHQWISINVAQGLGMYSDVTDQLTSLHADLKQEYKSGNAGGFVASMQQLIGTLEQANANLVASSETRVSDAVQPPVGSSSDNEIPPPSREEATTQPTPVVEPTVTGQPPATDNIVKVIPRKPPHSVVAQKTFAVSLDSVFVTNRITRDMGKYVKMAMGKRAGTILNTRCKIYSIQGERLQRIALGYVASVTPDDCTIRITGFTAGKVCRPGDIVIFDLPRDFVANLTRH